MVPVIALVGRPNVGKSTLFNRLTKTRDALVAEIAGLTRDRKYGEGKVGDYPFIVIDTGGISGEEEGIDEAMAHQSYQAIQEADIVFFMVDSNAGILEGDIVICRRTDTASVDDELSELRCVLGHLAYASGGVLADVNIHVFEQVKDLREDLRFNHDFRQVHTVLRDLGEA